MTRPLHRLRFRRDHRWVPAHASEYLDAELGPSRRRRLEHHTRECPECRELLRGLRALIGALATIGADQPPAVAGAVLASIHGRLSEVARDEP